LFSILNFAKQNRLHQFFDFAFTMRQRRIPSATLVSNASMNESSHDQIRTTTEPRLRKYRVHMWRYANFTYLLELWSRKICARRWTCSHLLKKGWSRSNRQQLVRRYFRKIFAYNPETGTAIQESAESGRPVSFFACLSSSVRCDATRSSRSRAKASLRKDPFLPVPSSGTGCGGPQSRTNRRSGKFVSTRARVRERERTCWTTRIRGERKVRRFVSNVGRKVPRGREPSKYCWGQQVSRASGLRPVAYHTGILPRATGVTTQRDTRSVSYRSVTSVVSNQFVKAREDNVHKKLHFYLRNRNLHVRRLIFKEEIRENN